MFEKHLDFSGLSDEAEDALRGFCDGGVHCRKLVALEWREHVVGDVVLAVGTPDPYFDAADLLGAERFDDGAHAVVAAVAALHPDAHGPQRRVMVAVTGDRFAGPGPTRRGRFGDARPAGV